MINVQHTALSAHSSESISVRPVTVLNHSITIWAPNIFDIFFISVIKNSFYIGPRHFILTNQLRDFPEITIS